MRKKFQTHYNMMIWFREWIISSLSGGSKECLGGINAPSNFAKNIVGNENWTKNLKFLSN